MCSTGATGYIGGDVLASVASRFPAASITALVRDTAKAKPITDKYPHVQLQQGDLDSADVIEAAVKDTDVVISKCPHSVSSSHFASGLTDDPDTANGKHIGVVHSIANGIRKASRTSPGRLQTVCEAQFPKSY